VKSFQDYLDERRLRPSSQKRYQRSLSRMLAYFNEPLIGLDTPTIEGYVQYLQKEGKKKRYINAELRALRHYYTYLLRSGQISRNPAEQLYLRGVPRGQVQDILSPGELEEALKQYQQAYPEDLGRQAALSLLIYQGAATSDLGRLRSEDIRLEKAEVFFAGSPKTAPRLLPLSAPQMLLLDRYLASLAAGEKPFAQGPLLVNRLVWMFRERFGKLPPPASRIKKVQQIRASVISHWLQEEDIRRVQYKAGHKYISSTEAYRQQGTKELEKQLAKYHPLQ